MGTLGTSPFAVADDYNYHGTECMTANLAQGQLFTWNKDGITNNFIAPLFVICPMSFDDDAVELIQTNIPPVLFSTSVSIFLPATVPFNTGVQCFVRFFNATSTGAQFDDNQTTLVSIPVTVGNKDFFGIGENDVSDAFGGSVAAFSDLSTGHLLCLLPGGSTLRAYDIDFF